MRARAVVASLAILFLSAAAPRPPAAVPKADQTDLLFDRLAKASDAEAKPIEDQILTRFLQSGSPSVDLLMARAASALSGQDQGTARTLLDAICKIAPNYAEVWHQRGRLLAAAGDDEGAIISLQKAVTLNPRQFAAMAELGGILIEYGDKRDALKIFRKALALDPHMGDVNASVQKLARDVEGEKI
ncbi:MAG TPA: tetratricopeptide repeat protein [Rhizomicrobium sp.]|jgi:tetratricopeptide (TPR) repeat protein